MGNVGGTMNNDHLSGLKEYKNSLDYTLEGLYEILKNTDVSFGKPTMGKMQNYPAIIYPLQNSRFDVYLYIHKNKIIVSRALKQQKGMGKAILTELALGVILDAHDADDTQLADTYVEEMDGIMKQIMAGKTVINSVVENARDGMFLDFYMQQKITLIKDKYSIYDSNETEKYYVKGNLLGLSFEIQDAFGRKLFDIQKKLIALTPEYTLLQNGREIGHIKKRLKLTKDEIVGTINGEELFIKGNISGYAFTIELNGKIIGSVNAARLTLGDCYNIKVLDTTKTDLVVAIAIICDNSIKNQDKSY